MALDDPMFDPGPRSRPRRPSRRRTGPGVLFAGGLLAAASLDVLVTPRAGHGRAAPPFAQACTVLWATPETVKSTAGRPVMIDGPKLVQLTSGLVLVGRHALETTDRGTVVGVPGAPDDYMRAGMVIRDDGRAELFPVPLDSGLSYPRIAALSDSTALVVWAHQDDDERFASTVWSAELSGVTWRNIQPLHRGEELMWGPTYGSDPLMTGGEVQFAAGLWEIKLEGGVILFHRGADGWRGDSLPLRSSAYVELADVPGDTLFVAAVQVTVPYGNALFAQRFDLAGRSVSELVRVSPGAYGPVYDPQVLVAGDSSLYLVWLSWASQQAPAPGDSGNQRLHLARSMDHGVSWEHVEGPRLDVRLYSWMRAMIDSAGTIHVGIVNHDSTPHPRHVMWDGAAWHVTEPPRVRDGELLNAPLIIERTRDSLRMLWGSYQASNKHGFPGVLLSSVGARSCVSPRSR